MVDLDMNRDYVLIIDKSGSMSVEDMPGHRSRWSAMQESTQALARKCEKLDPDGITVYLFSGRFKRFDNVTSAKVDQIFQEYEPSGSTNLAAVLDDAIQGYLRRKAGGQAQAGAVIVVVTDGAADDRRAVLKVVIEASRQLDRDEELGISFIQIGQDPDATEFLRVLDDELHTSGAKFDICDTITLEDMEDISLTEVLLNAIKD